MSLLDIRKTAEQVYLEECRRIFLCRLARGGYAISWDAPNKDTHRYTKIGASAYAKISGVNRTVAIKHLRLLAADGGWHEERRDRDNYPIRFHPDYEYHETIAKQVIEGLVAQGLESYRTICDRSAKTTESHRNFVKREWLRADGHVRPKDADGPVDVEFRDGLVANYMDGSSLGGWIHGGGNTDVMLYRPRPDRSEQVDQ